MGYSVDLGKLIVPTYKKIRVASTLNSKNSPRKGYLGSNVMHSIDTGQQAQTFDQDLFGLRSI